MDKNGIISVDPKAKGGLGLSMLRELARKDVPTVDVKLGSAAKVKNGIGPARTHAVDVKVDAGGGLTVPAGISMSGNTEVYVDPKGGFAGNKWASPSLVMGHELLGHAFDFVFRGQSSERSAVTTETNLLLQFGLPQFRPIPMDHDP
ncbi:MAG TPA: hypothetical protein VMU84_02910 [Thermoanaerobaculia bacterium]|nr:hypothetical protein [Thermoanaerobaculia bacterium]